MLVSTVVELVGMPLTFLWLAPDRPGPHPRRSSPADVNPWSRHTAARSRTPPDRDPSDPPCSPHPPRTSHAPRTPTHARSAHQLPSHVPAVAVIYYSSTGNVHALAEAAAEGAEKAGAEVRLRQVAGLAPAAAVAANPAWPAHRAATAHVPGHAGRPGWADAVLVRAPRPASACRPPSSSSSSTRPAGCGPQGKLAEQGLRVVHLHLHPARRPGATLLALNNIFYHWGGIIVPPGYTDPIQYAAGNPYGASHVAADGAPAADQELRAARHLGRRAATVAAATRALRESVPFHSMAGFRAGDRPSPEREAVR